MMTPAIRTQSLKKVYRTGFWMRPVTGLHGLDLEVPCGKIFGFIGPNGAGKTTTIKILAGLSEATSGQAWILGRPVDDPKSRRHLGFLPERPYFYEHLTAREVLDFYGQLFDIPRSTRRERIERLLEQVDLARFADVALRRYSKGMLQRVGLCQAILHEPELIVLDEPMSGLDPLGRALVRDVILEQRAAGRTVFFSTHVLSDVEILCDEAAILVGGRLRGVGAVEELVGRQIRHVDCAFRLARPVELPGRRIREEGNLRWVRLHPDEVDRAIDLVRGAGGQVIHVTPVRETLEQVLLDEVERSRPVREARLGVLA